MSNLEVRIRHESWAEAIPLAEIPFRPEAIASVLPSLRDWGGEIGGGPIGDTTFVQFMDDGVRAYLEVVVTD
jgi:hypothetical protein